MNTDPNADSYIKTTPRRYAEQGTTVKIEFVTTADLSHEVNLRWTLDDDEQGDSPWVDKGYLANPVHWDTSSTDAGVHRIAIIDKGPIPNTTVDHLHLEIRPRVVRSGEPARVTMRRTAMPGTNDIPLWVIIRRSSEQLGWKKYKAAMDWLLCNGPAPSNLDEWDSGNGPLTNLQKRRFTPFTDVDTYRVLKIATESFLMVNCGVVLQADPKEFTEDEAKNTGDRLSTSLSSSDLDAWWDKYLVKINGNSDWTLPYLAQVRQNLHGEDLIDWEWVDVDLNAATDGTRSCVGILKRKLTKPCLLELIWSYWHEEGMLVHALNAVSRRFQNVRGGAEDPLAFLEIGPLRPINNLLWGYIQDEQHRLTSRRRVYEYDHHYGFQPYNSAASTLRTADSRTKFLEAFHNLLYLAAVFYTQDDDTTVNADAFPILNALKDVHLVLSEGAHNQFGDLPSTARVEMLMEQWLLARPEFREFLPTRESVAYPEEWMGRVDAMKGIMGWTDTSVLHFRNLAVFGEQLLLSIRYGNWNDVAEPAQAGNWARYWRAEVQGYVHAYRAVTGVDLTAEITDVRQAQARYLMPSVHLRARLAAQQRALPSALGAPALPRSAGRAGLIRRPR